MVEERSALAHYEWEKKMVALCLTKLGTHSSQCRSRSSSSNTHSMPPAIIWQKQQTCSPAEVYHRPKIFGRSRRFLTQNKRNLKPSASTSLFGRRPKFLLPSATASASAKKPLSVDLCLPVLLSGGRTDLWPRGEIFLATFIVYAALLVDYIIGLTWNWGHRAHWQIRTPVILDPY